MIIKKKVYNEIVKTIHNLQKENELLIFKVDQLDKDVQALQRLEEERKIQEIKAKNMYMG